MKKSFHGLKVGLFNCLKFKVIPQKNEFLWGIIFFVNKSFFSLYLQKIYVCSVPEGEDPAGGKVKSQAKGFYSTNCPCFFGHYKDEPKPE